MSNQEELIKNPTVQDIYLGLNDLTDALTAFPNDIVSYFTLLKEIDAKCVYTVPHLKAYITRFLQMKKDHPKRSQILLAIRDCIKDLMPCLEEKMHVATIASDNSIKHSRRIEQAFDLIVSREIPELIRIGPMWEPCMKVSEPKSAQQQRSETRREAIAAKRVRNGNVSVANNNAFIYDDYDSNVEDSAAGNVTPAPSTTRKPKSNSNNNKRRKQSDDDSKNGHSTNTTATATATTTSAATTIATTTTATTTSTNSNNNKRSRTSNTKAKKENKTETVSTSIKSNTRGGGRSTQSHSNSNSNIEESYDGEPLYCYCQQVSYGEMVGCDGENCEREWFHLPCIGLKELPKGEWYCDDCKGKK